jgi:osmotically-inducible protein OsmY/sporulation protein YlmC with PRC-barrel domain
MNETLLNSRYSLAAVVAMTLALPSLGEPPPSNTRRAIEDQAPRAVAKSSDNPDAVVVAERVEVTLEAVEKARDVIGADVDGADGADAGKIQDLAVDLETGRILLVILSHGGVAGVGADHFGMPTSEFSPGPDGKTFRIRQTAEALKKAPKFDLTKWPAETDSARLTEMYRYYAADYRAPKPLKKTALPPAGESTKPAEANVASYIATVERASKLVGATVRNLADEKIGTLDELLLNMREGRVVTAVVSSGGFLGIGDEKSVVPPMALQWDADDEVVRLDATREQLTAAPRVGERDWPKQDRDYVSKLYRSFGFEDDDLDEPDADNTARNKVDRDASTLTPLDQGNSAADLDTTSRIRKAVVGHDDLSINAKNVKIVTLHGKVTLRGAVNSQDEKAKIEEIAESVAGAENVHNQLQVKKS